MRTILTVIILFISIHQFAEKRYIAKAYFFAHQLKDDSWKEDKWRDCDIPIFWENDSNFIRIFSEANQLIQYTEMDTIRTDTVNIYKANSVDENNLRITFSYIEFKEGYKYMQINYVNMYYVYAIKEVENF